MITTTLQKPHGQVDLVTSQKSMFGHNLPSNFERKRALWAQRIPQVRRLRFLKGPGLGFLASSRTRSLWASQQLDLRILRGMHSFGPECSGCPCRLSSSQKLQEPGQLDVSEPQATWWLGGVDKIPPGCRPTPPWPFSLLLRSLGLALGNDWWN